MYQQLPTPDTTHKPLIPSIKSSFTDNAIQKDRVIKEEITSVQKPGKPCFLLKNVLTRDECQTLIAASENLGYEDAEKYCFMYRDRYNDRLMSDDTQFSDLVWERIKHLLPKTHKPTSNYGNYPERLLHGLNSRWRYCRYTKDHYFGAHCDGSFADTYQGVRRKSYLTFMLYLNGPKRDDDVNNDDEVHFTGGSTNFFTRNGGLIHEVIPEPGMALVFLQEDMDMYHDGGKLTSGTKYILRTDVMYQIP